MRHGKVVRFIKDRYVTAERDIVAEDYRNSDSGCLYGWWILLDGIRVASLEYRCFLEEPVHMYGVTALHETFFQINLDSHKWDSPKLSVQSKYAPKYSQTGLQMAAVGKDLIVVQNLAVPEKYFAEEHASISAFHQELLAKAEKHSEQEEAEEPSKSSSDSEAK